MTNWRRHRTPFNQVFLVIFFVHHNQELFAVIFSEWAVRFGLVFVQKYCNLECQIDVHKLIELLIRWLNFVDVESGHDLINWTNKWFCATYLARHDSMCFLTKITAIVPKKINLLRFDTNEHADSVFTCILSSYFHSVQALVSHKTDNVGMSNSILFFILSIHLDKVFRNRCVLFAISVTCLV